MLGVEWAFPYVISSTCEKADLSILLGFERVLRRILFPRTSFRTNVRNPVVLFLLTLSLTQDKTFFSAFYPDPFSYVLSD